MDLVARDKKGNPVPDLKPADVEISVGSSPVRLNDLRPAAAAAQDSPYLVTLVFDQMEHGNARMAQQAAAELLKAAPAGGISFAVLKVDGRLRLLQEFTANREALSKAAAAATVADTAEYAKENLAAEKQLMEQTSETQELSQMLLTMLLDSQQTVRDPHSTPSVAALLAVSRGQRRVPGRKTVVYFSQGLKWDIAVPETLGEIAQAANRARVSLYAIDAHIADPSASSALLAASSVARAGSMSGTGVMPPSGRGGPSATGPGMETMGAEQMGRTTSTNAGGEGGTPLERICLATGGLRMGNSGDVRKNVRRIVGDMTSYYMASFIPPSEAPAERYRPLRVEALRAGITVQARAGFFAKSSLAVPAASLSEGRLLEALAAPKLAAELPFRSALLRFWTPSDASVNVLVVEVPLQNAKADGAPVSVLAQLKDKTGAVVQKFSEDIPVEGGEEQRPDALSLRRYFHAPPGQYVLETVALDPQGGKIGAQRANVEILPETDTPALGDVVVVRRMETLDSDFDRSDPLRCTEGGVIPNLSGRVSRAANPSVSLFFDVRPNTRSSDAPVLKAEVRLQGKLIATVPLSLPSKVERTTIPYVAKLGAKSLRPGSYELTMILTQGAQTARRTVSFTLEEP